MQPASSLKLVLDQIDNVRRALGGLKTTDGDGLFYEKLLSSLPQFVVCGPQSAGKSSVIRRVSSIALPEASTLCTRIATIIQLRRESVAVVQVCLLGPDGSECWREQVTGRGPDDEDHIRNLVRKAQDDAIARSGRAQFVHDHTVLVKVHGPDRHSVTLVDLPGFHTSSDADSKKVNAMVKRYIEMPGTLVMHVVKGDQDYDSTLGNDFMRNHGIDRVTVLTHCDRIEVGSAEAWSRLQITLAKTSETSSMTFAVAGSAKSEADEAEQLKHLNLLHDEHFGVGARPLGQHLEERMRRHLVKQMPIAVDELQTSLDDTNAALLRLEHKPPGRVVFEFVERVRRTFREEKVTLMNEVRELVMKLATEIKNYEWGPEGCNTHRRVDEFDELEPGTAVYVNLKPGDRTCKKVFVTSVASIDGAALNQSGMFGFGAQLSASRVGSELVTMVFWEDREGSKVLQSGSTKKSDVYSGQVRHESSVAQQIILAAHNRGTRNILHVDRQQIITVYMQEFARHYSAILTEGGREVRSMVSKMIDDVFSSSEKPCTAALANELRRRVSLLEAEAHEKMDEAFRILEKHNVHPDLLFTTNEHYLNDLVQKMLAADKEMTSDAGSARHIYHNVRAFLKVQRKQVCETAAKELVRTGVLLVEEAFEELMTSDLSDCHHLLEDELESVTKQRTKLEARKRVLEQAATLLPPTKRCKRGFLSSLSRS